MSIDPTFFKSEICFGINYAFEKMPFVDYIFVHEKKDYDIIAKIVDNKKLVLPNKLFKHHYRAAKGDLVRYLIPFKNTEALIYDIQDPHQNVIDLKQVGLKRHSRIFTWSSVMHSAIHVAAYMGAKNIVLVGADYKCVPKWQSSF